MALANTTQLYGTITKTFHWLMALLIFTLIPLGWYANQLPFATDAELALKVWLFSLHKTLGVTAFFVAVLRIVWALRQPKPHLLHPDRKLESFAAELVHWLLYGALVVVPLSGWISHAAAAGFAPIWWPFGQGLPLVPKNATVEHLAGDVHWVSTKLLILSLLLHIAGALKHHVIDRDATLRRMLPGIPAMPTLPAARHGHASLWAAVGLWSVVLMVAIALSSTKATRATAEVPELASVASDWQVKDGTLALSVVQFGNELSGSFADWTAQITFDETVMTGKAGSVVVTVSIPSLTLGSVTDQALGADFLNDTGFPQAVFSADILVASDGYEAQGILTLKDTSLPLTLPFALSINGDSADMRGDLTLDRRDFAVGDNVTDAATLGFDVTLKVTLKAQHLNRS